MNDYVRRLSNCIERVHFFGLLPEMTPLTAQETPLFVGVTTAWNALKSWGTSQASGNRGFREGAKERKIIARNIRGSMLEIASMARSIEISGTDPGISERFRMPAKRTYATLLVTAQAFVDEAEPAKALFIARGFAPTFVDDLEALITSFEASSTTRLGGLASQTSGTAGLAIIGRQGLKLVAQLRPIVRAKLKAQPALLAAWDLAARVEARGSSGTPTGNPPPGGGSGDSGSGIQG